MKCQKCNLNPFHLVDKSIGKQLGKRKQNLIINIRDIDMLPVSLLVL